MTRDEAERIVDLEAGKAASAESLRIFMIDALFATVAAERERCAKIADGRIKLRGGEEWAVDMEHNDTCRDIAAAIRAPEG